MTPKAALVVKGSRIHGRGVFATGHVKRAVRLVEYMGQRERWSTFSDQKSAYVWLMYTNNGFVIDPRINGNLARFINHSCKPNCKAVLIEKRVFIETLRKIQADEEITLDYSVSLGRKPTRKDLLRFQCICDSSNCRGTLLDSATVQRMRLVLST